MSKEQRAKNSKYSIIHGRSMCVDCGHELAWYDLFPVVSWLSLGGKCRYCRKSISWQYPAVELATSGLFVLSYIFWPSVFSIQYSVFQFGLWLTVLVGFVALTVYDIKWYLLPNRIVFPLQGVAGVIAFLHLVKYPETYNVSQLLASLMFSAGLFWVLHTVSRGKWIGYGDVKLAIVIGLVLGRADMALLMLFIASAIGSLVSIPLLIAGKANRSTHLPFGPFLMVGTVIAFLFGNSVVTWYTAQFLVF